MPDATVQETNDKNEATPVDQAKVDALSNERDELKDMLLRRTAEFDNYRKRTEKERADYLQYAGMDLVRDMLPVLDDFDRALRTECASPDYAKGVEMIYNRMFETLKKLGLEPIVTAGAVFDPHLHQAIEAVETEDAQDGAILGEFQRGYFYKGKLLRAAMVKVAARP